jgi:hypothetical protein
VLLAASHTDFYRPRLRAARLATPEAIAGLRAIEEGLARLPVVDLRTFLENRDSFRNRVVRVVAQKETERAEPVANGWRRRLGFRPEAIAGSFSALQRLAHNVRSGRVSVARTVRRIIVRSRIDGELLPEANREFLWQALELPLFEEVRGLDGELLAWECEAHAGLHVNAECALVEEPAGGGEELLITSLTGMCYPILRLRTGLVAQRARGLCGCGEKSGRLILPRSARQPLAMETAAFDFGSSDRLAR